MNTVTISLPESLKEFIEAEVETKGYGNVSDYICGLLREAQKKGSNARLEVLLLAGLKLSGEDLPLSRKSWSKLKADAAQVVSWKQPPNKRKTGCTA
jgi:antitoxin ParD1/3/4